MIKKIDFNLKAEMLKTILQNVIDALNRLTKTQGKKFKLENTPYAVLLEKREKIKLSILLKAAVNIIEYCEEHDSKSIRSKLRKHIEKNCIPRLKPNTADVTNFQVRISKKAFTKCDLLKLLSLYPQARNAADAVKMAFSEIEFIANNSKMNSYNSSPGGKKTALSYFDLDVLTNQGAVSSQDKVGTTSDTADISEIKSSTFVEPFARTMAFSLRYINNFENIFCGDSDYRFVNYYFVIGKWFNEFLESIKAQFITLKSCGAKLKDGFKDLKVRSANVKSSDCKALKISAAAALYITINVSFSGNEKNAVSNRMVDFEYKLEKRVLNLKYLSANLKKIQYVKRDFRDTINEFKNSPVTLILDPPYVKERGDSCNDYHDSFSSGDMLEMFDLLKDAKCKVILFHSHRDWFDKEAVSHGFRKVGYYVGRNIGKKYKPYYTKVYSLNIDSSVKFFDPKNHGELY